MATRFGLPLLLVLALAACEREERPQPPTAAEAERLDEADAMLDNLADSEEPSAAQPGDQPQHRGDPAAE
jgi:hypothetical protein